jgi:hypothetical protein
LKRCTAFSRREIQGAQADDGEDVAGVDDVGVLGDGEDGRHGVQGEHQIGDLDQGQRQEQGGGEHHQLARDGMLGLHEELRTVEAVGQAQVAAQPLERDVVGQVRLGLFALEGVQQHLDAGEQQEGREDVEDPAEVADQRRAQADHDGAQHDDADDPPEQHPVLVLPRNGEIGQDQGDDEDVVHRQREFDQIAGVVLKRRLAPEIPQHIAAERQADRDVEGGLEEALLRPDDVVLFVEDPEIQPEQGAHQPHESQPHPGWFADELGQQKIHARLPIGSARSSSLWSDKPPDPRHRAHSMRSDITTLRSSEGPGPLALFGRAAKLRKGGC